MTAASNNTSCSFASVHSGVHVKSHGVIKLAPFGYPLDPAFKTIGEVLGERGYDYDASTFPTFIGPLARAYYFLNAKLTPQERQKRNGLYGTLADGLRRIKAPALLISSPKDLVFPPGAIQATIEGLKAGGGAVEHVALAGNRGHLDGVLSLKQAEKQIGAFLAR